MTNVHFWAPKSYGYGLIDQATCRLNPLQLGPPSGKAMGPKPCRFHRPPTPTVVTSEVSRLRDCISKSPWLWRFMTVVSMIFINYIDPKHIFGNDDFTSKRLADLGFSNVTRSHCSLHPSSYHAPGPRNNLHPAGRPNDQLPPRWCCWSMSSTTLLRSICSPSRGILNHETFGFLKCQLLVNMIMIYYVMVLWYVLVLLSFWCFIMFHLIFWIRNIGSNHTPSFCVTFCPRHAFPQYTARSSQKRLVLSLNSTYEEKSWNTTSKYWKGQQMIQPFLFGLTQRSSKDPNWPKKLFLSNYACLSCWRSLRTFTLIFVVQERSNQIGWLKGS